MKPIRAIWHYIWEEPFSWIRDCFFQPAKFDREFGNRKLVQRSILMLRLALPMFLVSYPFALVSGTIFITLHLLSFLDITTFVLAPVLGIALGITLGIAFGIGVGIGVGIAFIASDLFSLYRLPLYPISGFSLLRTYFASRGNPPAVFTYLHQSALYWDERVYLPLPYLKRTLRLAAKEDIEQALAEITFIVTERPQQLRAARVIASEIAVGELELRKSLQDIAGAIQRLDQIFPEDARLIDPQWVTPFARLRDACQEAQRSLSPLGRQARYEALELMKEKLRRVHPNVAFRDQQLNLRLSNVIEGWLAIAQQEQDKLQHAGQEFGSIDNPYKPGIVLNTNDATFVGRRDLAQQLEAALSRKASRPTFMLYGERRMGKSSTLMYLPKLLGSRYLPIFCDLQKTGVASNIAIFLGTLAEEIHRVMGIRGIKVKSLSYEMLKQVLKENEAAVYHTFNRWFDQIERSLDLEDRTIVLTFDEFEQLADAQQSGGVQLPALLNWFRHTIQYRSRVALLFSGIHTLEEMERSTGVNWSSYFVNVRTLHVSFLQPEEAHQLVICAGEEIFGDGVVEMIINVTGCHPFLIQAVCSALIDNLNAERRERAEAEDVKKAVEQVLEEWRPYFHDLWRRTDEQQRACLVALRMLGKADISQLVDNGGMEERTVRQVLQTLVKRDLVRRDEEGMYGIAAPIFDAWVEINENHVDNNAR